MKNRLDSRYMLVVFEKVRQFGKPSDGGYELDGMRATSDFDGYTAFLTDGAVTLTLSFHNQYHCDYANRQQLHDFIVRADTIAANYGNKPAGTAGLD